MRKSIPPHLPMPPTPQTETELSLRAILTGALLGALLTPCNVYSGLKIGWSFNMSILALLVGFGFWRAAAHLGGLAPWQRKESNISQTTASAAASIISGGLVAPIPAHALLTGESLPTGQMIAWVFSVSFLGVWVGWYLRPLLIERSALRFPAGAATLEALRDIFEQGREAMHRLATLTLATIGAAGIKTLDVVFGLPRWAPGPGFAQYTFTLEPSMLLLGFGAIIGLRVGLSLLLGAVLAFGLAGPTLVASGSVLLPANADSAFGLLVEWLIWPGVTLMVCASLANLAAQLRQALVRRGTVRGGLPADWRRPGPALGLLAATALTVWLQSALFAIPLGIALLAVPFAWILAGVAARVVGDTGIPPIGAIGKVSQLGFGVAAPGQAITNLMTANVAGGAAGQCADLLNDFRAGHGIGASPGRQAVAQVVGIAVGSVAGVLSYQALIPDAALLLTPEWPAPAVATWKAVAETMAEGFAAVPADARVAMMLTAPIGIALGLAEALARPAIQRWLPSGVAVGLAFVIPASISIVMCAGALLASLAARLRPDAARRHTVTVAAGLVAGESIAGVVAALAAMTR
ncbi:MAG: OPT/YSL family transporter [Rhodocyclaceae bacterium]|nr:OPT/YSL family transporter [Rhodocyclaceae bacterium]